MIDNFFCAKMPTLSTPAFTRFDKAKSINRYLPPKGIEAEVLFRVNSSIVSLCIFENIMPNAFINYSSFPSFLTFSSILAPCLTIEPSSIVTSRPITAISTSSALGLPI